MFKSKKDDFLKYLKGKNLLITSHDLVDLDGFISGLSLKFFFENIFSNQNINLIFSKLSKHTKTFLKNFTQKFPDFNLSFHMGKELLNTDVIIIVDSNNLDQIKLLNNSDLNNPYIFIDHHLNLQQNYPNKIADTKRYLYGIGRFIL